MSSSLIPLTAMVSAVTAALVTLLIEFFAKPRLEIRKDRIVGYGKLLRELEAQLLITLHHEALVPAGEDEIEPSVDEDVLAELLADLSASLRIAENLVVHGYGGIRARMLIGGLSECRKHVLTAKRSLLPKDVAGSAGRVKATVHISLRMLRMGLWRRIVWRTPIISRIVDWRRAHAAKVVAAGPLPGQSDSAEGQSFVSV